MLSVFIFTTMENQKEVPYKKAIALGIADNLFVVSGTEIQPWNIILIENIGQGKLRIYAKKHPDSIKYTVEIDFDKSSEEGDFSTIFHVDYRCAETEQRKLMENRVQEAQKNLDKALAEHKEAIENQRKVLNQQRLNAM